MSFVKSRIITFVLYVVVFILLPIVFLFFLPFIIWRRFVSTLAKIFGGASLGKILNASSTSHATSLRTGTCVLPLIVEGQPNLEHIKDQFTKSVLNAKDGGRLFYPELRQTVVSWGGYFFWRNIPNFELPIRLLDVEPVDLTSERGLELIVSFYSRQWNLGQEPLWELLIIPGMDGGFGIVLVIHHTLGDSASCQTLIDKFSYPSIIPKKTGVSDSTSFPLLLIRTLFRIPYDAAQYLQVLMCQKSATARKSDSAAKQKKKITNIVVPNLQITQSSTTFHLPDLKKIAAIQNVSINALLMSAAQGSLQREWDNVNILYFPTPVDNHIDKLRNVGTAYVELVEESPQERLRCIQKQLQALKFSTFPLFSSIMGTLFGSLPPCLLRQTINGAAERLTFVLSTFICSRHPFSVFGYPVMKLGAMGCSLGGTRVVAVFAFSIGDGMTFTVMGDEGVVSKERGEALVQGVAEEFEALKELDSDDHINVIVYKT